MDEPWTWPPGISCIGLYYQTCCVPVEHPTNHFPLPADIILFYYYHAWWVWSPVWFNCVAITAVLWTGLYSLRPQPLDICPQSNILTQLMRRFISEQYVCRAFFEVLQLHSFILYANSKGGPVFSPEASLCYTGCAVYTPNICQS